jgi:UbiD family decarboxylase
MTAFDTPRTSVSYRDLREWIEEVDKLGELAHVTGADWNLEIGALTDVARKDLGINCPAMLFDQVPGYPEGFRVITNTLQSLGRNALTLGIPSGLTRRNYVDAVDARLSSIEPIAPVVVDASSAPVTENTLTGDAVDLFRFPTPIWHDEDGGRYIGTGDCVITRGPDKDWVNLGTYRVCIVDESHLTIYISPGKHGRQNRDAWLEQADECPVAISFGHDPLLWMMSIQSLAGQQSEYDYAGGLRGEPTEVFEGPVTGLLLPARSEILVEGFITKQTITEGPFGEWTGYYASSSRPEYVMRVEAIYHRDDPIIYGQPPGVPPNSSPVGGNLFRAAVIRKNLEGAGVPGIKDVCVHEQGGSRFFVAVSITQQYPGHARQVLMSAASSAGGNYMGKYVIVVDDDIDVFDLDETLWALFTRTDPIHSISFMDRCWSGPLDPPIHPDQKGHSSRALIDACRPWEWRDRFPRSIKVEPELRDSVREKWSELFR